MGSVLQKPFPILCRMQNLKGLAEAAVWSQAPAIRFRKTEKRFCAHYRSAWGEGGFSKMRKK
jgi:hypothetical protein